MLASMVACAIAHVAGATPAHAQGRSVVLAFDPGGASAAAGAGRTPTVLDRFSRRPELSLGLLGATQGAYTQRQALLDLSAGTRVSPSGYDPPRPPRYALRGDRITRWGAIVERAASAPTTIVPGALAGALPGGAAYVGPERVPANLEAVVAADHAGHVAGVSLGPASTLAGRVRARLRAHPLVVALLPPGAVGDRALDDLIDARDGGELLVVVRRPPRSATAQLLPVGIAGLRADAGLLTSRTTRRPGLVAGTDLLPTVLGWLGAPVPPGVQGRPITVTGTRDVAALGDLERRLRVVSPRRLPVLGALAAAIAATGLLLAAGLGARGRRLALRAGALALLWTPLLALACAALAPSRTLEVAATAAGALALGLATDRLVAWPRAPAVPALLGAAAYAIDLARGSDLVIRSLLGPNPRFGSRFYGIGNELEAILPVLVLVGVAAACGAMPRSRRLAATMGGAMLALGVVVGAGRLGADVGGVITIGAGGAVAVVCCLPGRPSRRALAVALCVPAAALAALAALDLTTGGDAHFTRTILDAGSPAAVADALARRYELALNALLSGLMPLATAATVALLVVGVRRRRALLAPAAGRPAWSAALAGGLAGAVAGALANDSGPVLLVYGAVVLGAACAYLQGDPRPAEFRNAGFSAQGRGVAEPVAG